MGPLLDYSKSLVKRKAPPTKGANTGETSPPASPMQQPGITPTHPTATNTSPYRHPDRASSGQRRFTLQNRKGNAFGPSPNLAPPPPNSQSTTLRSPRRGRLMQGNLSCILHCVIAIAVANHDIHRLVVSNNHSNILKARASTPNHNAPASLFDPSPAPHPLPPWRRHKCRNLRFAMPLPHPRTEQAFPPRLRRRSILLRATSSHHTCV